MRYWRVILLIAVGAHAGNAAAATEGTAQQPITFEDCLATIRLASSRLGAVPIPIVQTSMFQIVRFETNDGSGKSVLVTCSAPDRKLIVASGPKPRRRAAANSRP